MTTSLGPKGGRPFGPILNGVDLPAFGILGWLVCRGWVLGPIGPILSVSLTVILKIILEGFIGENALLEKLRIREQTPLSSKGTLPG